MLKYLRRFSWKYIPVSGDANGHNACEILFYPNTKPTQEHYNCLPLIGKPHKGFFAPRYSSKFNESISLAKHVSLSLTVSQIDSMQPEDIAKAALEYWKQVAFSSNP